MALLPPAEPPDAARPLAIVSRGRGPSRSGVPCHRHCNTVFPAGPFAARIRALTDNFSSEGEPRKQSHHIGYAQSELSTPLVRI